MRAAVLIALLAIPQLASARTWYVLPDSTVDAPTINAALDSSAEYDTILVGPGTYYGDVRFVNYPRRVLISEAGPEMTILDARDSETGFADSRVILIAYSHRAVVEGFTIQNGYAFSWPLPEGGGVYLKGSNYVILRGNIIQDNESEGAGAIGFEYQCCKGTVIEENELVENVSSEGAGCISLYSGGAEEAYVIRGNTFSGNVGVWGVLHAEISNVIFEDNVVVGNTSTGLAGRQYCVMIDRGNWVPQHIDHNLVTQNQGSGIGFVGTYGGGSVVGNTVADNTAYGITALHVTCAENVVVGNDTGFVSCDADYSCNDSWGNVGSDYHPDCDPTGINGNISANPCFCDRANGDYSIASESPCAPANSGGCGLIGALDVGCTATGVQEGSSELSTWGSIKQMFK